MLTETEVQGGTEMTEERTSKPLRPSGPTIAGWVILLFATCMTFVYATVAANDLLRLGLLACGDYRVRHLDHARRALVREAGALRTRQLIRTRKVIS